MITCHQNLILVMSKDDITCTEHAEQDRCGAHYLEYPTVAKTTEATNKHTFDETTYAADGLDLDIAAPS